MSSHRPDERGSSRARSPIWAEPAPGARRPSLTREQIADAALAIADTEGFEAVSMRRLATQLGIGTMTLYHYVRTKDDLKALMGDRIMAELLVPDDEFPAGDWKAAISAVARRSLAVFRRHPWVFGAMKEGGTVGPNGIRHFEQSLAAVESTGLDDAGRLEVIALVDDYVFGHALRADESSFSAAEDEWQRSLQAYVEEQLSTGEFPHIQRLFGSGDRAAAWERLQALDVPDERFERGLEALLTGIAARL